MFQADVIVMTQACDLEQVKVRNVVACPHLSLSDYKATREAFLRQRNQNPTAKAWRTHCNDIRDGYAWNLSILNQSSVTGLEFAIPGTACLIFGVRSGVPGIHPLSSVSDGLISRQPGYAVEVLIGTGELGQAIRLHRRHDQGIVAEASDLPAEHRTRRDQWDRDRQHLDAALQDSLNRLVEARELLHQGGMLSEPPCDPHHRPCEGANRFDGHDPVGHLGQDAAIPAEPIL